jgi:hypothetical protein
MCIEIINGCEGNILVFLIRDVTSCQREFNMSLLCSFHSDVRTTMIYMHVLNRGRQGVRSPADSLTQGLGPSQLSWN